MTAVEADEALSSPTETLSAFSASRALSCSSVVGVAPDVGGKSGGRGDGSDGGGGDGSGGDGDEYGAEREGRSGDGEGEGPVRRPDQPENAMFLQALEQGKVCVLLRSVASVDTRADTPSFAA